MLMKTVKPLLIKRLHNPEGPIFIRKAIKEISGSAESGSSLLIHQWRKHQHQEKTAYVEYVSGVKRTFDPRKWPTDIGVLSASKKSTSWWRTTVREKRIQSWKFNFCHVSNTLPVIHYHLISG